MLQFLGYLFLISSLYAEGFRAGTLIKTINGYTPIEHLQVNDTVLCFDNNNRLVERPITHILKRHINNYMHLSVNDECIDCAPNQPLYVSEQQTWIKADKLKNIFLPLNTQTTSYKISHVHKVNEEIDVYLLSIADYHNFCVSKADLRAHNFVPIAIGFAWAFGSGIEFLGFTVSVVITGIKLTYDLINNNANQRHNVRIGLADSITSLNPCRYQDAPYHHRNSKGKKSRAPRNGAAALENSLPMGDSINSMKRIGVSEGEIVLLQITSELPECIYHGYVIE
ncbi:MAG: polymorphic toxin-type HINT domain-containing protein [Candidatus Babeliaceae bacterium]